MRFVVAALLFLLLASPVFAGWAADITVNATDKNGRPLPGALVTISYQKNACKKFDDKETCLSNDLGICGMHIVDQAPDSCVNYSYSVSVLYMGKTISTKQVFSVNDTTPLISARFSLSIMSLRVRVVDFFDRPL
ncbi:MAG: hypothetical protein AB1468_06940, partial [Candidatus Micrarchaeota archaeon]